MRRPSVALQAADLDALMNVAQAVGPPPGDVTVPDVLRALSGLVGSDVVVWNRTKVAPRHLVEEIGFPRMPSYIPPYDEWARHVEEHPIMSGKYGALVSVGDVYSTRDFHRTWMYQEVLRPAGVEHEIGLHLSHPPGELHVVYLSRGPGRDFDESDRLVLRLLRPHLETAFRRLAFPAPRLTPRETDVLRLVRDGQTNKQIARRLAVTQATVEKHLENVYARTGVQSRVQAVNLFETALD